MPGLSKETSTIGTPSWPRPNREVCGRGRTNLTSLPVQSGGPEAGGVAASGSARSRGNGERQDRITTSCSGRGRARCAPPLNWVFDGLAGNTGADGGEA